MSSTKKINGETRNEKQKEDSNSFLDSFAAALAQALRENDEEQKQQKGHPPKSWEDRIKSAHETYKILCHDEPTGWTAIGCDCLTEALLVVPTTTPLTSQRVIPATCSNREGPKKAKKYALSHRLVSGIRQALDQRPQDSEVTATPTQTTNADELSTSIHQNDHGNSSSSLLTSQVDDSSSSATLVRARAMAKLAFCVHLQLPWKCIQATTTFTLAHNDNNDDSLKETISRWLGSYPDESMVINTEDHESTSLALEAQQIVNTNVDASTEAVANSFNSSPSKQKNDNDNINGIDLNDEVWAAESDPSDFEYESGLDYPTKLQELDDWAVEMETKYLDPIALSQPNKNCEWKVLAAAVGTLLQTVSYTSHLLELPTEEWTCLDKMWTPLLLILFVPPQANAKINDLMNAMPVAYWQKVGLNILHIWRDAVMGDIDKGRKSTAFRQPRLESYIQLLQQLLQVQAAQESDAAALDSSLLVPSVAPASWIGLSLFSALASTVADANSTHNLANVRFIHKGILESSDELSLLLERSIDSTVQTRIALQWTYLSFFQILSIDKTITSKISQNLLQSGLLRQWLVHWSKLEKDRVDTDNEKTGKNDIQNVLSAIEGGMLNLCSGSPAILGKYAWRFPDFAGSVTKSNQISSCGISGLPSLLFVDCLLWNLLGIHLSDEVAGGSSGVVLRKIGSKSGSKAEALQVPSFSQCQHTAQICFQFLCTQTCSTIAEWQNDDANPESSVPKGSSDFPTEEFGRFVDQLVRVPLLSSLFLSKLSTDVDGKAPVDVIRDTISPIKQVLQSWQARPKPATKAKQEDADDDNSDIDEKPSDSQHTQRSERVAGLRKSIKQLSTLLLDAQDGKDAGFAPSNKAD